MRPISSLLRDQRGGVLITTGLAIVFLIGIAGAALDLGQQQLVRARTQQSSDAAALAAGGLADKGDPQQIALRYFNLNFSSNYMGTQRPTPTISVGNQTLSVMANNTVSSHFSAGIGVERMNAGGRTVVSVDSTSSTGQNYDVILVMDNSGSMDTNDVGGTNLSNPIGTTCKTYNPASYGQACTHPGASRLNALRGAANTLVSDLLGNGQTNNRVAAVTWSDSTLDTVNLTSDYNTVNTFLGKMFAYAGTNSTAGLQSAQGIAGSFRSDSVHAVVLLTDGQNGAWQNGVIGNSVIPASTINPQSQSICSSFKSSGTVVYTIALGTPVITDSVARNFLQDCASPKPSGGKYYYTAPDGKTLTEVFQNITTEIRKLRISD